MNLVENDSAATKAIQPQETVARVEDSDQALINRADPVGTQQGSLGSSKPPASLNVAIRRAKPDLP